MTALIIADLHWSDKQRDNYRFQAMQIVADMIVKYSVTELLILGDLTESKDFHSAFFVNDVSDIMYSFAQMCEVYILLGNHDYTNVDCPFFHFLRRIRRVHWLTTVTQLELSIGPCLFLPHTRNHEKDWAELPDLGQVNFVFAHNTFEGATTEHGKQLNGIDPSRFNETTVISGDIHAPQTFGPVTYVGSPYLVDFGDNFEPRVLLIPNNTSVKSIPVPGPQKRLIGGDCNGLDDDAKPGDIVKIRYNLAPEEQDQWSEIKARLKKEAEARGLIVHLVQPVTDKKLRSVRVSRAEVKSDERIVADFGKQLKVPKASLDVGVSFLKEV